MPVTFRKLICVKYEQHLSTYHIITYYFSPFPPYIIFKMFETNKFFFYYEFSLLVFRFFVYYVLLQIKTSGDSTTSIRYQSSAKKILLI